MRWAGWLVLGLSISTYAALAAQRAWLEVLVNYDPTLQYLFASLAALKGWEYTYVDHPGTPVELLGSLILLVMRAVGGPGGEDFILAIVREPERFLHVVDVLFWIANLSITAAMIRWLVPGQCFQEAAFSVACGAAYFAIHPLAFSTLTLWSHNSFNFIAGASLLLVLVLRLRRHDRLRSWHVFAFGIAAGALTSIQLYFAAWIVGITLTLAVYAVLLGETKAIVILIGITTLIGSAVGFLICTTPILDQYLIFGRFVMSLILHQGLYGSGPEGLPSSALLLGNARELIAQAPLLFVFTTLVFALLVYRFATLGGRATVDPDRWAASIGLTTQTLILLVLIVKHPSPVYLLSLAATLPVLAACLLASLELRGRLRTWAPATTLTVVLIGVVWNGQQSIEALLTVEQRVERGALAVDSALSRIAAEQGVRPESLQVVWTYGTNNGCFARWFGDSGPLSAEIASVCPNELGLDVSRQAISTAAADRPLEPGDHWDALILTARIHAQYPWLDELGQPAPLAAPSALWGQLLLVRDPRVPSTTGP